MQSLREEENSQYNHLLDQHCTDECCKWYVGFLPNSGKRKTFLLDVYISLCLLQGNSDWKLEKLVLYPNAPQLSYNILPPEVFSEKSCGVSWWRQLTGAQAGRKTDLPVRLQIRIVWPFLCPSLFTLWPQWPFPAIASHLQQQTIENAKWRKCLKMPSCQKQTNYFVESHRNHSCNVKCCAMLCFMVSNCFVAPTLLCIRITALIMFQCVKDSAPTPFSRSGANRSGSGSPILLTEKHIWKLYGWGSAHSSEGPDQSFSKQDLLVFSDRSKRRKGENAKPKGQEQTL